MVTIVDYKTYQKEDGNEFNVLVVQSGLEAVKSRQTGNMYFTTRKATVSCTFDDTTCQKLIGTDFPGGIKRVEIEPYEFTDSETGEVVTRYHRNEYVSEEDNILENNIVQKEAVY